MIRTCNSGGAYNIFRDIDRDFVTITANVNKLAAMIRTCNSGGAYNIFRDIDRDFAVHYFIHGSKSRNFASQF